VKHCGVRLLQLDNPEFDNLINEEQRTGDHKTRIAILHQAGRILMEDVPFAPLYMLAELYGVARNVIWKGSPDGKILASEMKTRG
jgi:ABC-type oligopeptide transport system substrate-binding subunit